MAAVFSALWTALTVLLLAPFANYIPKSALAGILIVVAYTMIEKDRLRLTWKSGGKSRFVLVGTLAATLVLPLEYAIFVGVILSIVILLKITGKANLTHLVPRSDSGFDEVPFRRAAPSPVVTINLEGDLYFAATIGPDGAPALAVPEMQILADLGLDVMAIGNHEFGLGSESLAATLRAAFPGGGPSVLTANVDLEEAGLTGLVEPWTIIEVDGVNVGFFGLTIVFGFALKDRFGVEF